MRRKVIIIVKVLGVACLFAAVILYFTIADAVAQYGEREALCKEVRVEIADSEVTRLVLPEDVHAFLAQKKIFLTQKKLHEVNLYQLEELFVHETGIKACHAFTRLNGVVTLHFSQRTPLLRLETPQGTLYMDDAGVLFPTSAGRTAYVPVVSGNIPVKDADWMGKLFDFGTYIRNHHFWNAQVEQLYVHAPQQVELIQRVGSQTVLLGDLSRFAYKLQKLYTFYRTVAAVEGWDKYDYIDLRFDRQVVCRSALPHSSTIPKSKTPSQ